VVVAGAAAYFAAYEFSKHPASPPPPTTPASAPAAAFAPPPHSIAVLPFVNMSGDKEQDYFSDGLSEELLNSLARINELQVAARTSSFYFKGEHVDLATIARKLNVASVLEGSVRRSGNTVRITAQLNNAVTGFHLWSQTYERDLGDVLKLQTEIATAVANALKVALLGDVATKIEVGGTHNPAAFDAYLRGLRAARLDPDAIQAAIAAQTEAIRLDSKYALAFAARSVALTTYGDFFAPTAATRDTFAKALADARTAIALAPELGEGHAALAEVLRTGFLDFARAREEYERAVTLAPGNAFVLGRYGYFAATMGDADAGIAASRRAVALDRLNADAYDRLGHTLMRARHFHDAIEAYHQALALEPGLATSIARSGQAYYALGDLQNARAACESKIDFYQSQVCLAVTYNKLGQRAAAEAMLAKLRAASGDAVLYQYAQIYAQWGNLSRALEELEAALRLRDPGLHGLKTDFLLDPLRKEPRFQAVMRELKLPE
jgi:TolB-like protein/Tfp pilus assembly protein PilF